MTPKQRRFVEAYTGNATEAAIKAGYTARSAYNAGDRLMKNDEVIAAIKAREETERERLVAARWERQRFWTSVMRDECEKTDARLKASELLGKSEADFTDIVRASVMVTPAAIMEDLRGRRGLEGTD
jgi:phage terminase small subunit